MSSSKSSCPSKDCSHSTDQVVLTTDGMDGVAGPVSQIRNTLPYNRNVAESYSFYDQYLNYLRRPVVFKELDKSKMEIHPDPCLGPIPPCQKCSYPVKPSCPICPVGKVALVVGASKNVGLAVALYLRCLGYNVIGTSRKPSAYTDVAKEVLSEVPLDIRDSESVKLFFSTVIAPLGRLDLMVLCAGIGWAGPLTNATGEDFQAYLALKPVGFLRCINAAVPTMRKFTQTRIICFGANYGSLSLCNHVLGSAATVANHAVTALTQSLNVDERQMFALDTITNPVTYITVIPNTVLSTYDTYDVGMSDASNGFNPLVALSNIIQGSASLGFLDPFLKTTPVKLVAEQVGDICLAKQPGVMYFLGDPSIVYPDYGMTFAQIQTLFNSLPATDAVNANTAIADKANHVLSVPRVNELRMQMLGFFLTHRP